jgi:ABC-2 type transport system ATP-binding protein
MPYVAQTHRVGKRYRQTWALRDCTIGVAGGRIVALVGPNGAGKTTLLNLLVGLTAPSTGSVTLFGAVPAGSRAARERVAFVAADTPLYPRLSVAETVDLARALSPGLDVPLVLGRLGALGIPLGRRAGRLSGGQQAQLALSLALGRRPDLLVLDEPHARLDPLARHDFMASLADATGAGISVVLSSHIVAELERTAGDVIVLCGGRVVLDGPVDGLLREHGAASLEELVLAHLRAAARHPFAVPAPAGAPTENGGAR